MRRRTTPSRLRDTLLLSGWLFADLLLGLMMIFLVSAGRGQPLPPPCATFTAGLLKSGLPAALSADRPLDSQQASIYRVPPSPTPCPNPTATFTPTPTSGQVFCGLDAQHHFDMTITVNNPDGLRDSSDTQARKDLAALLQATTFAPYSGQLAGYVEVYGGGFNPSDVGNGVALAMGVIDSLKVLAGENFVFSPNQNITYFQDPLWSSVLNSNQARLFILFYLISTHGLPCSQVQSSAAPNVGKPLAEPIPAL